MLQEIIERGTPTQRRGAMRNLTVSAQVRGHRRALTEFAALRVAALSDEKKRVIYDAENGTALPGKKIREEGEPPSDDPAVNEAYDGSGATYDLFNEIYGRNSIDNKGMRLDSTVHYQQGYDNAFWNGQQMVYGDGDEDLAESERLFNRFTIAIDIVAHELTHGVTQHEAGLVYREQSGALNESWSDVFGSLVKQRKLDQMARDADWLIGAGLLTANVRGEGLRSMKAPGMAYDDPVLGKDPQPAHMQDYKAVPYDNGGVHINSGIPNHAFYVTAHELGGYAWEKAGQIWYVTLRDKLRATSNFQTAAQMTYDTAGQLYGSGSLEQQAVQKGWAEVGLLVEQSGGENGGEEENGGNGSGGLEPSGCWTTVKAALGLRD
jgi:Zn-dependent metalloprotease